MRSLLVWPLSAVYVLMVKIIEWRFWSDVRIQAAKIRGARIGARCRIERGCYIAGARNIVLGDDVYIGPDVYIVAYDERVVIQSGTMIAAGCRIITRNHVFQGGGPIRAQGFEAQRIQIGRDVWLGFDVLVLPGVVVGDHAVVAAGAVVTTSVPEYAVVAGVPARKIAERLANSQA